MAFFSSELLADIHGLSEPVCAIGLAVGLLLWLFGWWGHRFFIVLFTTVAGGLVGLHSGRVYGIQPMVTGVLLAIAAGLLALALVRLLVFTAGGLAACLAVQALSPAWNEPFLCFLSGGLMGVLLFRMWTMALTSLLGVLFMGYAGLCLADSWGQVDAPALADQQTTLLNGSALGLVFLGVILQYLLDRQRGSRQKRREELARVHRLTQELEHGVPPSTWLAFRKGYRRAG